MTIAANQNAATATEEGKVNSGLGPKNPTIGKDRRVALPHVAVGSTVDTPHIKPKNRSGNTPPQGKPDRVERIIVGIVLFVLAAVPLLTFLFSFGNVGDLGKSLGVDYRIAYLTGPGVDLTATGMIVAATWLSYRGMSERELWRVHALSIICALIMFALNCGPAIYQHRYQLAGFSAVGPFLLMAMGYVGPWLLRQLTDTRQPAPAATGSSTAANDPAATGDPAPAAAPAAGNTEPAAGPGSPAAKPHPQAATGTGKPKQRRKNPAVDTGNTPGWADLALPLWLDYIEQHGEAPTAPALVGRLRNAYPNLKVPESERSERNIRAATEKLAADRAAEAQDAGDEDPRRVIS